MLVKSCVLFVEQSEFAAERGVIEVLGIFGGSGAEEEEDKNGNDQAKDELR